MTERPIDFVYREIIALMEGRKTQARRLVLPQPKQVEIHDVMWPALNKNKTGFRPYCVPGDHLWVREMWRQGRDRVVWGADPGVGAAIWQSSQSLPREKSRFLLNVTGIRLERLQDISETDASAEGAEEDSLWRSKDPQDRSFVNGFREYIWHPKHHSKTRSWEANPWVLAIEFERVS